ncbi:MAG: hypothetical protein ACTHU0_38490, partial [Kofleriaceae bacterium]
MTPSRSSLVGGVLALMLSWRSSHADPRPAAPPVDWARGLVTATGLGIADRHAPSPATARGPARRAAEIAARQRLAAALPKLPLAEGGTLADRLADPQVEARIARAVEAAIPVAAELQTDGSWSITMAVPIEAIRQALAGPRVVSESDRGPAIVIVDGVTAKPAVGYKLGAVAAPSIWVKDVPSWAKGAPRVKARSARRGAIELADAKGGEATLFVI